MSPHLYTCHHQVTTCVWTEGLTASAVVYVLVKDVNDNSPYFEPLRYSLNVESAMVPGPLLTVQAADLDSGINGTVTYSFVNDNTAQGLFTIDAGSGVWQGISMRVCMCVCVCVCMCVCTRACLCYRCV